MTHPVFLTFLNMGLTAGYVALAVMAFRLIFRKAPKWLNCALWGLVGLRLICPVTLRSVVSLIPSAQPIPLDIELANQPAIQSGIPFVNSAVNPVLEQAFVPGSGDSVNPLQIAVLLAIVIWLAGMVGMALYALISTLRLHHKVKINLCLRDNIYLCDGIDTPFILGVFRPRIYLPSHLTEATAACVIAHEQAHLKRLDHLWKPLGFLLLTVYWFHPLLWISYHLLCKDIEFACDEKVIKGMEPKEVKEYSAALLHCSVAHRAIAACPLAFGETGVKGRIKSILHYKKPAFWVMVTALVLSLAIGVCFLTDPLTKKDPDRSEFRVTHTGTELSGVTLRLNAFTWDSRNPALTVEWYNETETDLELSEEFYVYRNEDGNWVDTRTDPSAYTFPTLATLLTKGSVLSKTYSLAGMTVTEEGCYRFETKFSTTDEQGNIRYTYTALAEYELGDGSFLYDNQYFQVTQILYQDGSYSYEQSVETAPRFQALADTFRRFDRSGDESERMAMTEISPDKTNLDSRFSPAYWELGISIPAFRKTIEKAWEIKNTAPEANDLYLLLRDKNGSYYIAEGYYNISLTNPQNPDRSSVRWLYRVEHRTSQPEPDQNTPQENGNPSFTGVVKEVLPNQILVDITDPGNSGLTGQAYVSTKVESTQPLPELQEEDSVRVVYNGTALESYPLQIPTVFAIYKEDVATQSISSNGGADPPEQILFDSEGAAAYHYYDSPDPGIPSLQLQQKNHTFTFFWSVYSSYYATGTYTLSGNTLTCRTADGKNTYVFRVKDGAYVFDAGRSSAIPDYKYSSSGPTASPVPDGAVFRQSTATLTLVPADGKDHTPQEWERAAVALGNLFDHPEGVQTAVKGQSLTVTYPAGQTPPDLDTQKGATVGFYAGEENGGEPLLDSRHIAAALAGYDQGVGHYIDLTFTDQGKTLFAQVTANNIGNTLSLWLGDQMLTAPMVQQEITDGVARITGGNLTAASAKETADTINRGLLFPLKIQ